MTSVTRRTATLAGTSNVVSAQGAAPAIFPTRNGRRTIDARITEEDEVITATTGAATAEEGTATNTVAAMTDKTAAATRNATTSSENARSPATSAALQTDTDTDPNVPTT